MTRLLYQVLLVLALPWVWVRLKVRARREPAYRLRREERFGRVPPGLSTGAIWFHTVSAGETNAAAPVIRAVQARFPGDTFLVTTMTPTGSARVTSLLGETVEHCYAPYDYPWAVARFLRRVRPRALVLMETELWPNLVEQTAASGASVYLVNARLSARSYRGYRRIGPLVRRMLGSIEGIVCQYEDTAARFRSLGATSVVVTGSVKFDAEMPPDGFGLGDLGFGDAPVWIAGSTHGGEEETVLDAHRQLRDQFPNIGLILVPRHPQRAAGVAQLAKHRGFSAGLLSDRPSGVDVLVGDVMGTLAHLYPHAGVAFVGGSLDGTGGHNPIEAAVHGLPMLMGPTRHDVEEICARFAAAGCFYPVTDADDIARIAGELFADPGRRAKEGESAKAVVDANRGARQAVVNRLCDWLRESDPPSRTNSARA